MDDSSDLLASKLAAREGSTKALLKLLDDDEVEIVGVSLAMLSGLVLIDSFCKEFVAEHGSALLKVVEFLDNPDIKIQRAAAHVLNNVAVPTAGARAIAQHGQLDKLVRLIEGGATRDAQLSGTITSMIGNFTWKSINRAKLAAASGAIPPLARLTLSKVPTLQAEAANSLRNILEAASVRAALPDAELKVAIAALVRLLVRGEGEVQSTCAIVLNFIYNSATDPGVLAVQRKALVKAGAVPVLLRQIHSGSRWHSVAMALLSTLVEEPGVSQAVADAGVLTTAEALRSSSDEYERMCAAKLLHGCGLVLGLPYTAAVETLTEVFSGAMQQIGKGDECAQCGAKDEKLCACSRCGLVYYCSSSCQKQHWAQHKQHCCTHPAVEEGVVYTPSQFGTGTI